MKEDITPYTNIANNLLDNEELTPNEKLILIVILSYYNKQKGYAYPSYTDLKRRSSLRDTRTLNKAVNRLIEKDFMRKETSVGIGCKYFLGEKGINLLSTKCKITPSGELHQVENYTRCKVTPGPSGELHQDLVENYTTTNTNINTKKNTNVYSEIINYLNEKTGRHFEASTESYQKLIKARLKKATVEDIKLVIKYQSSNWMGKEDLERCLTPDTLFCAKHFNTYLTQARYDLDNKKNKQSKYQVISSSNFEEEKE